MKKRVFNFSKGKKPSAPTKQKRNPMQGLSQEVALTIHLAVALEKAQSEKIPFNKQAFCEKHGFAMKDVEATLEGMLASQEEVKRGWHSYEVPLAYKEYELTGWRLPPDEMKLHFEAALEDTAIFEVFDTPNTLEQFSKITGGSLDDELKKYGVVDFMETLFHDNLDGEVAFLLMNAFFWILFYNGDRWLPVRSYAIEMLKLFPHEIQKSFVNDTIFIDEFSTFIKKKLATRGICSLKARPTPEEVKHGLYAIKATDAFYSLLKPLDAVKVDLDEYFLDI